MICPNCLANNKNNATVCQNCGYSLIEEELDEAVKEEQEEEQQIEDESEAETPAEINQTPEAYTDQAEAPYIEEQPQEDEQKTISIPPLRERTSARRIPQIVYEADSEEEKNYFSDQSSGHKNQSPLRTAVTVFLWVLIIAAVIFIGFMLYDRFWGTDNPSDVNNTGGGSNITSGVGSSNVQAPSVSLKQDESGASYYECIFYGQPGDSVYLTVKNQYYSFDESGKYTVELRLSDFVDAKAPLENTYSASVTYRYRQSNGQETELTLENPLVFNISSTQLKLIAPEAESQEIFEENYSVIFKVDAGSTVLVNGRDISSSINSQGRATYNVTLGPGSSEELNIQATAPYHSSISKTITISRAPLNVNFSIAANTPRSVNTATVEISGVVDTGATLSCADYTLSNPEINPLTGAYRVSVQLPGYGRHRIILTATSAEGQTSSLAHTVLYLPEEDAYTRDVWVYDPAIVSDPSRYIGRNYLLNGVDVVEILDSPNTIFTVNMGTDEAPQYLAVEYYGSRSIQPGDTYRIFGQVIGSYQGMTLIGGYFLYTN